MPHAEWFKYQPSVVEATLCWAEVARPQAAAVWVYPGREGQQAPTLRGWTIVCLCLISYSCSQLKESYTTSPPFSLVIKQGLGKGVWRLRPQQEKKKA